MDGVTTEYYLNESAIQTQITGNERLDFFYDDTNTLIGFEKYGNTYYYLRDGIGNITGLIDSTGKQVVAYTYDTWGKVLSITGEAADTIGQINPFRYKDYYLDTETGLYYLNGRYYDPQVCRFINAKGMTGVFETVVNVGGRNVSVRGNVINGVVRIGTAFIK